MEKYERFSSALAPAISTMGPRCPKMRSRSDRPELSPEDPSSTLTSGVSLTVPCHCVSLLAAHSIWEGFLARYICSTHLFCRELNQPCHQIQRIDASPRYSPLPSVSQPSFSYSKYRQVNLSIVYIDIKQDTKMPVVSAPPPLPSNCMSASLKGPLNWLEVGGI